MSTSAPTAPVPWLRSRYGFAFFHFLSLLVGWLLLRVVLLVAFKTAAMSSAALGLTLLTGLQRDVFVALVFTLPLLCWFMVVPEGAFALPGKTHRWLLLAVSFGFWFVQIFL